MQEKQVALVTGTSTGFGMLTAIELAKQGYFVIATMRDLSKNHQLKTLAIENKVDSQITYLSLDVTDEDKIQKVVTHIIETYGNIEVLVNNAGISIGGVGEEIPKDDWTLSMDTNFYGTLLLTQAVLPNMRKARTGKIINVSSVSGRVAYPGFGSYAASKFAVEGFSESLRIEMLPYNVFVVLVEPGVYQTDIWSKGFEYVDIHSKANSPYKNQLENLLAFSKKLLNRASDPQQVARKITRIAKSNYPNFRYLLGRGSRISILLRAIMPWKWYEKIISHFISK